MAHSLVNYDDVDPVGGGLHFLRDSLDCSNLGVSVLDVEAGWSGKAHDHADDGQEEVYVLVEGAATVTVEDETVSMSAGDALRVDPEATRQVDADADSLFVIAGAS
ncbi:cupin domain-containing protein [Haloplanus rubicundus]|uniref:Cupin domain-containing protein n=1 Tax=Haloplanus rubicundus TaxID=1547898 RepID=A0A345EFL9_9EURY|nr:cupin domain-containing protein [Haloplanus rubicundus]AXG07576.1 cupin domain-containing protein [Haloplanus rubicundus]AXG10991.1 cupin domain-containing protein [Haloplanus rubicundus]